MRNEISAVYYSTKSAVLTRFNSLSAKLPRSSVTLLSLLHPLRSNSSSNKLPYDYNTNIDNIIQPNSIKMGEIVL